jgi:hypothetical protein
MAGFTVGALISASMRKIGVLAAGEPLPADEGDDALQVFINMVDAWSLESLLIPVVGVVTHTLVANQPKYTLGIYPDPQPVPLPDNHIETARPQEILSAFIRDASGTDYPLSVIGVVSYDEISRKTNEARPSRFYLQKGWPLNTIYFDATPYASETLHLSVIQPFSEVLPVTGLTEVINLPPGYKRALEYNLALDLADEWGKQVSNTTAAIAAEGKRMIKRSNSRKHLLGMDRALTAATRPTGTYIINQGP